MSRARLLPVLLVALMAGPPFAAAQEPPRLAFPEPLLALPSAWIDAADKEGRDAQGRPVSADAQRYLDLAREAAAQGRFRVALFDLDTHHQLVETRRLLQEAATQGALARQRDLILVRDATAREEALREWDEYREALHALDGRLKSLHAVELALYSADLALAAVLQTYEAEAIRAAFARDEGIDETLVAGLVRSSLGVTRSLGFARDVLDAAAAQEGLPPRLDAAAWNETVQGASAPLEGEVEVHLRPLQAIGDEARPNGEGLLLVAVHLSILRQERAAAILQLFGDAQARGLAALRDATSGLERGIRNVSVQAPRDAGLLGVFTADALDQSNYTLGYAREGLADMPSVAYAWSALDHQAAATALLADAAEGARRAGDGEDRDAPAPGPLATLALLASAAVAASARGPRRGAR